MTERTTTPEGAPFGDLMERKRARKVSVGATADDLVARHLDEGRYFVALGLASAELERRGEGYETYARLARCEAVLGLLTRARRSWTSALRFRKTAEAFTGLGAIRFQTGDPEGAIRAFHEALAIDADHVETLESLATAHLHLGQAVDARRYANLVLARSPERLPSRLCRARAEILLGNARLARGDVGFVLSKGFKVDEARLLEVDLLLEDAEFESALFLAAQLCEKYPDSRECLDAFRRAFVAFDESGEEGALEDFLGGLDHFAPLAKPFSRPANSVPAETVDIVIPVHDAWLYVERCHAALTSASGPLLGRIILVDDASSAFTQSKLQALAEADDRVTLVRTARQSGFSKALARGLAVSDTKSFVALNSDTVVTEGWLEKLVSALRSSPGVTMVGPLSNNAGWQNYCEVLDREGRFHGTPTPSARCREDLAAEIGGRTGDALIPAQLIHGFCVLADRAAYDACGGLDEGAFPEGYGEFQDLSIRMRGAGHDLLVVADCVVFHEKGASLSQARRASLSLAGRKALYDRYSALNYLCLEMLSLRSPALEAFREDLRPVLEAWGY